MHGIGYLNKTTEYLLRSTPQWISLWILCLDEARLSPLRVKTLKKGLWSMPTLGPKAKNFLVLYLRPHPFLMKRSISLRHFQAALGAGVKAPLLPPRLPGRWPRSLGQGWPTALRWGGPLGDRLASLTACLSCGSRRTEDSSVCLCESRGRFSTSRPDVLRIKGRASPAEGVGHPQGRRRRGRKASSGSRVSPCPPSAVSRRAGRFPSA